LYPALAIDKSAEVFEQNVADWTEVIKTYQEGLEWCASQGTRHYETRHKDRGLLLGITIMCGVNDELAIGYTFSSTPTLLSSNWDPLLDLNSRLHPLQPV
jgi:hypothetical protein